MKLFWLCDGGMHVLAKRLESGTFRWPQGGGQTLAMTPVQLQQLLSGIDLSKTRPPKWWLPVRD